MKKIFILPLILLILLLPYFCNAEYISFYPDNEIVENYIDKFIKLVNENDPKNTVYKVKPSIFFPDSWAILKAVQYNQLNFGVIPLFEFTKYNVINNITPLLKKIYSIKENEKNLETLIPLKLVLEKYNIFLIDLIPLGNYYFFSNENINITNKKISVAITNPLFYRKIKKIFPNTFIVNNLEKLKKCIVKGIFNSAILTPLEYSTLKITFKNVASLNLPQGKLCFVANLTYWNNLNFSMKSLVWSFTYKNKQIFQVNRKKLQDKLFKIYFKIKRLNLNIK